MYQICDNAWLELARGNLKELSGRALSESDTRRLLIEPVLAWIGYNIWSIGEVEAEASVKWGGGKGGTGAVDYALKTAGQPYVLVEAKPLGALKGAANQDIVAVKQLLSYCHDMPQRPRWGIITDGRFWTVYDESAKEEVPNRRLLEVDIAKVSGQIDLLRLLSPLAQSLLRDFADAYWKLYPNRGEVWYESATRGVLDDFGKKALKVVEPQTQKSDDSPTPEGETVSPPPRNPSSRQAPSPVSPPPGATHIRFRLAGQEHTVRYSTEMFRVVMEHVLKTGNMPVPYRPPWSERYLVTRQAEDINIRGVEVVPGTFVEMNWSAAQLARLGKEVVEVAGLPGGTFEKL